MMRKIFIGVMLTVLFSLSACTLNQNSATVTVPTLAVVLPPTTVPVTSTVSVQPTATLESTPTFAQTNTPAIAPTPAGTLVILKQIKMLDKDNGWAVGRALNGKEELVLNTHDGGRTWADVSPEKAQRKNRSAAVFFMDSNRAWVIFGPEEPSAENVPVIIWRTEDSGANWQNSTEVSLSGLNMDFFVPTDLGFSDSTHGWLMAHLGVGMNHDYVAVLTSADGGATWNFVVDPSKNNLYMSCSKTGILFQDAVNGWIVGDCHGVAPQVYDYQTVDGGKTWNPVTLPEPSDAKGLFADPNIACGLYDLRLVSSEVLSQTLDCADLAKNTHTKWAYLSADGGKNWSAGKLPVPFGNLFFLDAKTGWLLGNGISDTTKNSHIYHTSDGGKTWKDISTVNWGGPIDFVDKNQGWVLARIGQSSTLVHSKDGGTYWDELVPVIPP